MSFLDRMREYITADLKIVEHLTRRFSRKPEEPVAGIAPQPMTQAPQVAGGSSGVSHFYYPGVGGGGSVSASGGSGGGSGGTLIYNGTSGQVLAYDGRNAAWRPAPVPTKLKADKPAGSFKDLNATEEAVVHNVAQYEGTELVREKDGTFSYCRKGVALGKDRVRSRTVNVLIKKKFLDVIEFGERGEALVCGLGSNIRVHGR
ncbi:hypothetical protein D869_gp164 [Caulobacter phage CcrRogue]|uniref:Uncharacterized protein n=1 Tax=Caulobacter phage CcrRogue TaxID=2927986 RepID=K4JR33_9CAUD|nr:hypothetical protein D869_gp164 [Caulobacter phage CcrRogue]AFU86750.1 hypothetical protein CcrRogue_gp268 [Caulobacter phage CcrRogue]